MADPAPASLTASEFIAAVREQQPKLAVFDCDGTLWSGDAGQDFLYWELDRGLLPPQVAEWVRPRYADYKAGKVDEETMCGEMVTIHCSLDVQKLAAAAERFWQSVVATRVFPEMQELVLGLMTDGCEVWAVSSTNDWVIQAGCCRFGIPAEQVLAASVLVINGRATDRLVRVPTGAGKARVIEEVIKRQPDAVFGNTVHDQAMLEMARNAYAIAPTDELRRVALDNFWTIYDPAQH